MSKATEYLGQAEFCRKMADRAASADGKLRWLELAGKWVALADETTQLPNDWGTGQERSGSGTK